MSDRPETGSGAPRPAVTVDPRDLPERPPGRTSTGVRRRVREVEATDVRIHFDQHSVWRAGWIAVAVIALAALGKWVLTDGGNVIFTLVMSVIASIAMEPAVAGLSQRMRRGLATALVMLGTIVFLAIFLFVFGQLLGEQIATFARALPSLVESVAAWANETFGITLDYTKLLDQLGIGTTALATVAQNLAGGLFGVIAAILGAAFGSLTFAFFTYYFSADGPRLRRWVASLVPPRQQEVVGVAWDLAVRKTGGYVAARLALAAICGGFSGLFMLVIGMPYWLALGVWTGIVAQFVPNVGTYIAIALPVFVGLVGEQPWQGLAMLVFALVYQQIENLTIEPRISAQAVDVHPAVSFASVLFGASLFGVGGAFVAVPVAALMLALFDIYSHKYELLPHIAQLQPGERDDDEEPVPDGGIAAAVEPEQRQGLLHRLLRRG